MKKGLLTSLASILFAFSYSQNKAPVAVDDTVTAISQVPLIIDVMANDYDMDGDGISIYDWDKQASLDTVDGKIRFISKVTSGRKVFHYIIKDDGIPARVSNQGIVYIFIQQNPEAPVARADTFDLLQLVPISLDILGNDYDPQGDELKIADLASKEHCDVIIDTDSLKITVIPRVNYPQASFKYLICEKNKPESLISDWAKVYINIIPNPDIPVALPDSAVTIGGVAINIPVMQNDYDLQGDLLEFRNIGATSSGQVTQSGDSLIYLPDISFSGKTSFRYRLEEAADSNIYSNYTDVYIEVSKNPDCPVGIPDQASGITFQPMLIDVLANDFDPNGKSLAIFDIRSNETANISGNHISYSSQSTTFLHDTLYYRNRQSNHEEYYSEWTAVFIDLAANPDLPVAIEDHATAISGSEVIIAPLLNDLKNASDSLVLFYHYHINQNKGRIEIISDSLIAYQPYTNESGQDIVEYYVSDKQNSLITATGLIYIDIISSHFNDSLVINNINAGVNADGMLFADMMELPGQEFGSAGDPHFKYPAGTQKNTIFNSTLWLGGLSGQNKLHYAGEIYKHAGNDFLPGPVSKIYNQAYIEKFRKVWKINKSDVEYHRNNWWKAGYQPIDDIASWPGNGDVASGQSSQLAPYSDFNLDGKYDPMDGDYPLIRGDQTIFFICNDDTLHMESHGIRMKIEIHGMVYGFDAPDDSVLSNTVFVHYDIINRSDSAYHNTYAGVFTELDIGNPWDDYFGSDVSRSSYYGYNGNDYDEDIEDEYMSIKGYGEFPPAQSVTILAGPFIDPDGSDNPSGGCDFSVNGSNFGNGISDDERFGLCRFTYFHYSDIIYDYPVLASDYYDLMNGYWFDGTPFQFGGSGHFTDTNTFGNGARFLCPGDSDPLNWGTNCLLPNGGYNQNGNFWTDSSSNYPGDRRGLGAMGPFTFAPGQVQEIELAYCAANGWNGPVSSVIQLMKNIDTLRSRVNNGEIIVPNSSLGINEKKVSSALLNIFPNPASDFITIQLPGRLPQETEYLIYNVLGEVAATGRIASGKQFTLDISALKSGFYIVMMKSNQEVFSSKFIKY